MRDDAELGPDEDDSGEDAALRPGGRDEHAEHDGEQAVPEDPWQQEETVALWIDGRNLLLIDPFFASLGLPVA